VDGGYYLPPCGQLFLALIDDFEKHKDGGYEFADALGPRECAELERLLKTCYFRYPASVCRSNFTFIELTERRSAARTAYLFPGGNILQFGDDGAAKVFNTLQQTRPGPIFFYDELNQVSVDFKKLEEHIHGRKKVDCTQLIDLLRRILASEAQTECYLHVNARNMAQQEDAVKSIIFNYGPGRGAGKTVTATLLKHLGMAHGVFAMISKVLKKAFTADTRDMQVIQKTLKDYQMQAVLVIDEVGAKGDKPWNQDNTPINFNAVKSWQDGSKDLYVAGHATTVQVTNYPLIILTGNTGSPADAFTCSPNPGDAKRVYPLYFGGCEGEDTGYEARAKAARELVAACKADRAGILLQYLALMVDYAKVPLANHKHVSKRNLNSLQTRSLRSGHAWRVFIPSRRQQLLVFRRLTGRQAACSKRRSRFRSASCSAAAQRAPSGAAVPCSQGHVHERFVVCHGRLDRTGKTGLTHMWRLALKRAPRASSDTHCPLL